MKLSEAIVRVLTDKSVDAIASNGQYMAQNMLASNVSLSYGELLESILEFPVEAELPRTSDEAVKGLKGQWCWDTILPGGAPFLESLQSRAEEPFLEENEMGSGIIEMLEHQWMLQHPLNSSELENIGGKVDFAKSNEDWDFVSGLDLEEAKAVEKDLEEELMEQEEVRPFLFKYCNFHLNHDRSKNLHLINSSKRIKESLDILLELGVSN